MFFMRRFLAFLFGLILGCALGYCAYKFGWVDLIVNLFVKK